MAGEMLVRLMVANLAASVAIVLVLSLRDVTKRVFGAQAGYRLWAVPLFAFAATLVSMMVRRPASVNPVPLVAVSRNAIGRMEAWTVGPGVPTPEHPMFPVSMAVGLTWLVGAVVSAVIILLRQRHTVHRLGRLTRAPGDDFWRSDTPALGPALVGILRPRLVVPADFDQRYDPLERRLVLAHEQAHLQARDTWINGLIALIRCLNWFNPLVHLAAHLARLDQELACDAAVVARFPGERRVYAEALLKTQLAPGALPLGCTWPTRSPNFLRERILMLAKQPPGLVRNIVNLSLLALAASSISYAAWAVQPEGAGETSAGFDVTVEPLALIPQSEIEQGNALSMAAAAKQGLVYDRWDEFNYARYFPAPYHSKVPQGWVIEMHTKSAPIEHGIPSEDTQIVGAGNSLQVERDERSSKRYTKLATVRVEEGGAIVMDTIFVINGQPTMARDVRVRSGETVRIHLLTGEIMTITPVLRPVRPNDPKPYKP